MNKFAQLRAEVDPWTAVDAALEAVAAFDRVRKGPGERNGALGTVGRDLFGALCRTGDWEPDITAFDELRPHTGEALASKMRHSRSSVSRALADLEKHGFLERGRSGLQMTLRPIVPDVAIEDMLAERKRWNHE